MALGTPAIMRVLGGIVVVALGVVLFSGCSAATKITTKRTCDNSCYASVVRAIGTPTQTRTATVTATATVTGHPIVRRTVATRTRTRTVTYTPPPPKQYGAGEYFVGRDIKPGVYRSSGGGGCYWARLASLDTSNIIDNDLSNGPMILQVRPTDRAIYISGNCSFGRA